MSEYNSHLREIKNTNRVLITVLPLELTTTL